MAEGGKVLHPAMSRAAWVPAWGAELVGAPQLPEDDRCDVFAMAVQRMRGGVEAARAVLAPVRAKEAAGAEF